MKLQNESNPEIEARICDTLESALTISSTAGLQNLSDSMKNILTDGLEELSSLLCIEAYHYFQLHDFEPTPEIIPIMRKVVQAALEKGEL